MLFARWPGDVSLLRPLTDYRQANFHIVTPWGARLARHPRILDQVERIIGLQSTALHDGTTKAQMAHFAVGPAVPPGYVEQEATSQSPGRPPLKPVVD